MEIAHISVEKVLFALPVIACRRGVVMGWDLGEDSLPAVARLAASVLPMVLRHTCALKRGG